MHDLERKDANRLAVPGTRATIFANEDVPVDAAAVSELRELLRLEETADALWMKVPERFSERPRVERVSLSPDFHKGAGIPIGTSLLTRGFAVPQAIGNDVNCGVRLHRTSLSRDDLEGRLDDLVPLLRRIFFEGGRSIPLTREQRVALLRGGLAAFLEERMPDEGIYRFMEEARSDLARTKHGGSLPTTAIVGLEEYAEREEVTRDSQIGSVGGGNHFVELQYVERVAHGPTAHAWGLAPGRIVVMAHSGSVSVGHICGSTFSSLVRRNFPAGLAHPSNGIFPLGDLDPAWPSFWNALHNAAHFAFANRMFLAFMMKQALVEVAGELSFELVYDTPHNLAWKTEQGILHRKGASPAGSFGVVEPYFGEPVLVPGSMGASSWVMEGLGNDEALGSASHGAGRKLTRGAAAHASDADLDDFLREFRIVTPVRAPKFARRGTSAKHEVTRRVNGGARSKKGDPERADVKRRRDVLSKWRAHLKEEAPWAYKAIGPVMATLRDANVARPVAELRPLLTVKG